jgi:hypothetical protein
LRNGAVIDEGPFEDLKRYSLVFKELWEHQNTETEQAITEEGVIPMTQPLLTKIS